MPGPDGPARARRGGARRGIALGALPLPSGLSRGRGVRHPHKQGHTPFSLRLRYGSSHRSAAAFNPVRRPPSPAVVSQARNYSEPGREPSSRRGSAQHPPPLRCGTVRDHSGGLYLAFGTCPALDPALIPQRRRHPTAPCPQAAGGPGTAAPRPISPRRSRGWQEGGGGLGARGQRPRIPEGRLGEALRATPSAPSGFPQPQPPLVTSAR